MAAIDDMVVRVRTKLAVNQSHDASIREEIEDAVTYFLRNFRFLKGFRYIEMPVAEGDRLVVLPPDVGEIRHARLVWEGGYRALYGLPRLDKPEVVSWPSHYWRDGLRQLWLQGTLPTAATLELFYKSRQGASGTLNGPASEWLLNDFRDAVFYRVMVTAAPSVRKGQLLNYYLPLWQDVERGLHVQQEEEENSNNDTRMTYQPADYGTDHAYDPLWVSKYPGGWDNV